MKIIRLQHQISNEDYQTKTSSVKEDYFLQHQYAMIIIKLQHQVSNEVF